MLELFNKTKQYVFGGYNKDEQVRFKSTSGGAFSAIVDAFCDENYVIFGAEANGLDVFHSYIMNKSDLQKYRKSKYIQSKMGSSFRDVRKFLLEGKKVLFSGTPCQIAGLKMFLQNVDITLLLTVEVVCEGVPSPLYLKKYEKALEMTSGHKIESIDYRYTGKSFFKSGKWDFEVMKIKLTGNQKEITVDRWFNPFWSIWLNHLMSRPSCYICPFAKKERTADITLGDLWGVHLYCPELYGKNCGSSLIVGNSDKGIEIIKKAQERMYGHELKLEDALKYQSPMRKHIEKNTNRDECLNELQGDSSYEEINKKWAQKPTLALLWKKYVWGNRQKIWLWNLTKGKYHIR